MNELDKRASLLSDQVILMKLILTQSMISNYQRNELPEIKPLESMIKNYDDLIEQTKEYTQIKK